MLSQTDDAPELAEPTEAPEAPAAEVAAEEPAQVRPSHR